MTGGGGIGLLCFAIMGIIMSDKKIVKILSSLYVAFFTIIYILGFFEGRYGKEALLIPALLIIFAFFIHGVHHIYDVKNKE
jgi:ABC-type transport system involved in multi-copper enzyme maturation permease subunit